MSIPSSRSSNARPNRPRSSSDATQGSQSLPLDIPVTVPIAERVPDPRTMATVPLLPRRGLPAGFVNVLAGSPLTPLVPPDDIDPSGFDMPRTPPGAATMRQGEKRRLDPSFFPDSDSSESPPRTALPREASRQTDAWSADAFDSLMRQMRLAPRGHTSVHLQALAALPSLDAMVDYLDALQGKARSVASRSLVLLAGRCRARFDLDASCMAAQLALFTRAITQRTLTEIDGLMPQRWLGDDHLRERCVTAWRSHKVGPVAAELRMLVLERYGRGVSPTPEHARPSRVYRHPAVPGSGRIPACRGRGRARRGREPGHPESSMPTAPALSTPPAVPRPAAAVSMPPRWPQSAHYLIEPDSVSDDDDAAAASSAGIPSSLLPVSGRGDDPYFWPSTALPINAFPMAPLPAVPESARSAVDRPVSPDDRIPPDSPPRERPLAWLPDTLRGTHRQLLVPPESRPHPRSAPYALAEAALRGALRDPAHPSPHVEALARCASWADMADALERMPPAGLQACCGALLSLSTRLASSSHLTAQLAAQLALFAGVLPAQHHLGMLESLLPPQWLGNPALLERCLAIWHRQRDRSVLHGRLLDLLVDRFHGA